MIIIASMPAFRSRKVAAKLSAKLKDNAAMGIIILPGLLLQRMTAKEPDDSQIEVAIAALKEVLKMEEPVKEG